MAGDGSSGGDVQQLGSPPWLPPLFAKAVGTTLLRRGSTLPQRTYEATDVTVDAGHLSSYAKVVGSSLSGGLPVLYPHVLAFPLAVRLMSDLDFPFPLVGLVHVRQQVTQTRSLDAGETLSLRVRAEGLAPHPKGAVFDVVSEALVDGEVVWSGASTYLRRGADAPSGVEASRPPELDTPGPESTGALWRVPDDIGRRYGAVAGDVNPIHLHPLSARLLGFPKAIAHGLWEAAHCLAALEGRLPEALHADIRFAAPLLLPATVRFATAAVDGGSGGWAFALHPKGEGKPHLLGTVAPA